jgi:hypothetical protein
MERAVLFRWGTGEEELAAAYCPCEASRDWQGLVVLGLTCEVTLRGRGHVVVGWFFFFLRESSRMGVGGCVNCKL